MSRDDALFQRPQTHLVLGQVALFVQTLRGHHHGDIGLPQQLQLAVQVAVHIVQTARAKGLDEHALVPRLNQQVKDGGVDAGGELQQEHMGLQLVLQLELAFQLGQKMLPHLQTGAGDPCHGRVIDGLKGIKARGAHLDTTTAQQHLAVKGQKDPRLAAECHGNRTADVVGGIGERMYKGQLAAGEHHGDGDVVQHIAESRGGIAHGVGAVGDDDAVILLPAVGYLTGDDLPFLGLDVGGIQRQNVTAVHPAVRQIVQTARHDVGGGKLGGKAVFGGIGGDGAAGGENQNVLHKESS